MPETTHRKTITCKVCGAEFYPNDKWQIEKEKLLLAEGVDVHRFLIYACAAFEKRDIHVINFKSINELRPFLKILIDLPEFAKVKTLVVARDAETNVTSAIESVKSSLSNVGLPVPPNPFEFKSSDSRKTAFMLFPGPDTNNQCQTGAIEHLCLKTVSDDPLIECVDGFLECANDKQDANDRIRHPWKSKLYAYLAGKNDHAGKRLSQAARDKVWNWDHPAMIPFKTIIQNM